MRCNVWSQVLKLEDCTALEQSPKITVYESCLAACGIAGVLPAGVLGIEAKIHNVELLNVHDMGSSFFSEA